MATTPCSCDYKTHMIAELRALREKSPGKETDWVDVLFPAGDGDNAQSPCCLLTLLCYYGYCKESPISLSDQARSALAPLLSPQDDGVPAHPTP